MSILVIVSDHAHEDPNQADEENNGGKEDDFHRSDTEHIPPSLNGEVVAERLRVIIHRRSSVGRASGLVCIADLLDYD